MKEILRMAILQEGEVNNNYCIANRNCNDGIANLLSAIFNSGTGTRAVVQVMIKVTLSIHKYNIFWMLYNNS